MAGILKSKVATYEFSLTDMKVLIANDLGIPASQINVTYVVQEVGGDPMDRFPGTNQVTGIRVTVTEAPTVPPSQKNGFDELNYGVDR